MMTKSGLLEWFTDEDGYRAAKWPSFTPLGSPRRSQDRIHSVPHVWVRSVRDQCLRAKVPFQREVLLGGATDAGSIALAGAGTLTGCVSIPSRHIHSAVGVVHLGDMEQCVDLLLAFAELLPLV